MELPQWDYAYGSPIATGKIKSCPADFIVEEQLPFTPSGSGEHVFLHIEKTGENTEYVARILARIAGVRQRDIGVAGLKDRHAVTTQWFSVWLPTQNEPEWADLETDHIKILQIIRHTRKLKRGVLTGNQFTLVIRDFEGDKEKCEQRLETIKAQGFPNYFGEQRFGHQGQNINTALALFEGTKKIKRQQRGIYLSAARSYLFNKILSKRIQLNTWNQVISGDALMFNDSHSYFKADDIDDALIERIATLELHPTACLYGKGDTGISGDALAIENEIIAQYPELSTGLIKFDLETDRRPLRAAPKDLRWQFLDENQLQLSFFLQAGSYATALLREIVSDS
ncbi:MAG: tRNA pseudouridine(13) synthase TruD [Methylococcaceae bacterium]|nr:tRNA pseudouridine(13) synthase TruD [Methylococcaceae bacterium]